MYPFNEGVDRKGTACIKWDFQEMDYKGKTGLLPFSIADADYRTYPPILQALKDRIDNGVIGYTDLNEEYYSAVKGWCRRRHDWKIESNWIIPTGGIVPAMCNAIEALTSPSAGVIVQPPVYDPFYSIVQASGRRLLYNDLLLDEEGYHMDIDGLRKIAAEGGAEMLLLCSQHNPVCRVWTYEELKQVVDICKEYHIILVSDEIHWDLILGGRKHVTIGQFPEIYEQMIVCTSCSKTFNIAGLETSNLIIPGEDLRGKYQNYLYSRYLFCPNTLGLESVKAAYQDGDEWVDEVAKPEGTYLLWLDMRAYEKTSDELIDAIAQEGAGLNSGKHYGDHYDGFVRMNVACPQNQLLGGLQCIQKALEKF